MTDENKPLFGGRRIFITVVQEDGELEGQEIMQNRKMMIGDLLDPQDRRIASLYYDEIICELVYERRRLLADGNLMSEQKREYNRDEPVAMDDRDPGNTEPEELTAPLDRDDDVYNLVFPDQGDLRGASPAAEGQDNEPRYGH